MGPRHDKPQKAHWKEAGLLWPKDHLVAERSPLVVPDGRFMAQTSQPDQNRRLRLRPGVLEKRRLPEGNRLNSIIGAVTRL